MSLAQYDSSDVIFGRCSLLLRFPLEFVGFVVHALADCAPNLWDTESHELPDIRNTEKSEK